MKHQLIKTIGLGMVAGMRSASAPALLSEHFSKHPQLGLINSGLNFLQKKPFAIISKFMAAGEFAGDKLPNISDRISPAQLSGRALSGALVGAGIYKGNGNSAVKGALIGAASAIAFSFISYYLRTEIQKKTKIDDKIAGFAEDTLAVVAGAAILKSK